MADNTQPEPLTIPINGQPVTASMDEWRRVMRAVNDRSFADLKAWQAERRAAGQVWLALYWRHHSVYSQEFFGYEEALSFLRGSSDNGDIGPYAIKLPSGEYINEDEQPESPKRIAMWEAELR